MYLVRSFLKALVTPRQSKSVRTHSGDYAIGMAVYTVAQNVAHLFACFAEQKECALLRIPSVSVMIVVFAGSVELNVVMVESPRTFHVWD